MAVASAAAFFFQEKTAVGTYMHFDPDNARSYIGFVLPPAHLAALDQARIELRLSRSEFVRQAVTAHLRQLEAEAK